MTQTPMHIAVLSARDTGTFQDLTAVFTRESNTWTHARAGEIDRISADGEPDVLMIDLFGPLAHATAIRDITIACHRDRSIPVLALVPRAQLAEIDATLGLDDFVLMPADPLEILTRATILVGRYRGQSSEEDVIQLGDLRINISRYEVWVGIRQVTLTFKEYELLRLLASQPGHVFTRDVLLDRVWGYDYFGGTRTVDVHVRRLRSKLEDPVHSFVETVRNVGYRLRAAYGSRPEYGR